MIMHRNTASFAVLTILFIGCLIIACGFMGFVQAKKVDSPDPESDAKLKYDTIETNDTINLPMGKPFTTKIKMVKDGKLKREKTLQTYPDAEVWISEDTETIMQLKSISGPFLEIYYGYQRSAMEPWQYYYRVEDISKNPCRVVRADFATKRVWIEYVDPAAITAIVNAGTIPAYGALP